MSEPVIATKKTIEEIFDGAAARYDRAGPSLFQQSGARLIELLAPKPGERVLDVATGVGAILIPAAQCVGSHGRVVGIEISSAMLEEGGRAARAMGLSNFELRKMDAEHLELTENSFDVVACGFALFLFPSMDAALREMYRVCKPGRRVGLTVWGKDPFDPAWKMFAEQVRAYGVEVRMPHKVAYAPEELRALLNAAGFVEIDARVETVDAIYSSEEDWWEFQFTAGTRAALLRMSDERRAQFKEEYLAKLRPLFRADGLHLPAPVLYGLGRKA